MSIEKSPAPAAGPKVAARQGSHAVHAKAGAGSDAASDGTGSGFMAILGALGDADAGTGTALAGADSNATSAAQLPDPGTVLPAFDASLLLQQNPQIAAAQALQAAAAAAAASTAGAGSSATALSGVGLNAASASAAQNPTALLQAAAGTPLPATASADQAADAAAPARTGLGAGRPALAGTGEGAAGKDSATRQLSGSEKPALPESLTQALQHAGAHARALRDAATGDSSASAANSTNNSTTTGNERLATDKAVLALEQARASEPGKAAEPLLAPLLARQEKPQGERTGAGYKGVEPTYSGSSLGVSAPDVSQSGAPAPVTAPEMQVAEQVSYWVSQNVQNAELKLDGLGQSPVQVSISVQGNEAQISFHTDEAATRSLLEHAGTHLKDLLQREGMLLTGVSVGSSGSGEAGGGERRARQNVRQGVIAPLQASAADSAVRQRSDAGRAVDLFV